MNIGTSGAEIGGAFGGMLMMISYAMVMMMISYAMVMMIDDGGDE